MNPYAVDLYAEADKAPGVTSVHIPASVEAIDPGFFQLFPNAAAVQVAAGNSALSSHNGMVFSKDLENLLLVPEGMEGKAVLPDSLATVPACAFSRCSKLSAIHLESGSTGGSAFSTADGILYTNDKATLVAAPAGLGASAKIAQECTRIAEGAFWGNTALRTIVAPGQVETVGAHFGAPAKGEDADTEDAITDDITSPDRRDAAATEGSAFPAFSPEATRDATVQTDSREAWEAAGFTHFAQPAVPGAITGPAWGQSGLSFKLLDDFTFSVRWEGTDPATEVDIPAEATLDGIAYKVSTIEEGAFEGQDSLAKLTIPATVTSIGAHAFAGCTALAAIDIPGSVTAIGEAAFEGCTSLADITPHEGLRTIGEAAFKGTAVQTMVVPASTTDIGSVALSDNPALTSVVALGNGAKVAADVLQGNTDVDIYVPYNADGSYTWSAGAPVAGNHILPYGAKMAQTQLTLTAGDTADLFADGGYLHAPGAIEVQFAYNAKSITVDGEGVAQAIQPGNSTVTARLTLSDQLLSNTVCAVRVVHKPQPVEQPEPEAGSEAGDEAAPEEADQAADEPDPNEEAAARPPIFNADVPLEEPAPADPPQPRPEITTGEYLILGTSTDNKPQDATEESEAARPPIYSDDVMLSTDALDQPSAAPVEDPADTAQPEDQPQPETAAEGSQVQPTVANAIEMTGTSLTTTLASLSTFADAAMYDLEYADDVRAIDYDKEYTTYLHGNGGNLSRYVYAGNPYTNGGLGFGGPGVYQVPTTRLPSNGATADNWAPYYYRYGGAMGQDEKDPDQGFFHSCEVHYLPSDTPQGTKYSNGYAPYATRVIAWHPDEGYTFGGWSQKSDSLVPFPANSEGKVHTSSVGENGGLNVYAYWIPKNYTIILDLQGGTSDITSVPVTYDAKPSSSGVPKKDGYTFAGYWTGKNKTGTQYYNADGEWCFNKYTVADDLTLYAGWDLASYTLTVYAEGGKWSDDTTSAQKIPFNYETDGIMLPWPVRDGWTFVGWEFRDKLVENCANKILTGYKAGTPISISSLSGTGWFGNGVAEAVWRCKITLDCSRPTGSPSGTNNTEQYVYYYDCYNTRNFFSKVSASGSSIADLKTNNNLSATAGTVWVTAPPDAFGYTFLGFVDGSTTRLTAEGKVGVVSMPSGDVRWEASWKATSGNITLDVNGGQLPSGKSSSIPYTIESTTFKGDAKNGTDTLGYTPTRTNWEFVGWVLMPGATFKAQPYNGMSSTVYEQMKTAFLNTPVKNWLMMPYTYSYGSYTLKAMWKATITLNANAPQKPTKSTIQKSSTSTIAFSYTFYYYTDRGFYDKDLSSGNSIFNTTTATTNPFKDSGGTILSSIPVCSDDGWLFNGVLSHTINSSNYTVIDAQGKLTADSKGCVLPANNQGGGNCTWTLQWRGRDYTASFDVNDGEPESGHTSALYRYGADGSYLQGCETGGGSSSPEKSLCVHIPSFSGWAFAGYFYTDAKGVEHLAYSTNDAANHKDHLLRSTLPAGTKENITLTAKWTRTIIFDPNGGTAKSKGLAITYGEEMLSSLTSDYKPTAPVAADSPSGTFWKFAGFYDHATNTSSSQYYDEDLKLQYTSPVTLKDDPPSTIYARWTREVKIDKNGGSGGDDTIAVIKGAIPSNMEETPSKEGYKLTGFGTQPEASSNQNTPMYNQWGSRLAAATSISLPPTIYAQWEGNESNICFDPNPPSGYSVEQIQDSPEDMIGKTGDAISNRALPKPDPTCPDYIFDGWYTSRTTGSRVTQLPEKFPVTGATYYAHWTAKPDAELVFTVEGDSYSDGGTLSYGEQVGQSTITVNVKPDTGVVPSPITAIADKGYTFGGWFDEAGSYVWNSTEWAPANIPEGGWPSRTTYKVKFNQLTYSIEYRCATCGSLSPRIQNKVCKHVDNIYGFPESFKVSAMSKYIGKPRMRSYYEFAKWAGTDIPGGETSGSFYVNTVGSKIYTVYATPKDYTLTLDAGEGDWGSLPEGYESPGAHTATVQYNVETQAFQLPQPKRAGHTFDHWELNGNKVSDTFTPKPDGQYTTGTYGNKTYTAVYSPNPYQITYDLTDDRGAEYGAGSLPEGADNPHNYDYDSAAFTLPIPARVGYDFLGWSEEEAADDDPPSGLEGQSPAPTITGTDPQIDVTVPSGSWGHRTYKAHWRAHKYDVAFDLDKGAWDDPQQANPLTATYDEDVTLPVGPKRQGYIFKGWQLVRAADGATATERFDAEQTVGRPNWVAEVGTRADQRDGEDPVGSVTLEALWTPNLSVDVVVGSEGVHMGLQLKADPNEPFETTRGTATLKNRSDGALKVVSVEPNPASDYDALKAEALKLFLTDDSLDQAAFMVAPSKGNPSNTQSGWFGIADSSGRLDLADDVGYMQDAPNHARNWMMGPGDESTNELKLYYTLSMGDLKPEDVDVAQDAQLHVTDLVYTVALVLP